MNDFELNDNDFEMRFYILVRDDAYQGVIVLGDQDPLFGMSSWSLYSGPFKSAEEAELSMQNS